MKTALDQLLCKHLMLPHEYREFLERAGGTEGELSIEPGWVQVWPLEEALVASAEYGLPELLPGYFAFGSSGGGELFVSSLMESETAVFMVPAVGMSTDSMVKIAETLAEFERAISPRA